jgi:uroporphyrinogen decarboxylase
MAMEVSPSVYEHAARILGRTPWEVSRDGELIYQAHAAAYEFYQHTPIMPGIDIYNLEPEAYGAVIKKPSGHNIPAIEHHPMSSTAELLRVPPLNPATDGRISMQIEAARRLAERFPEADIRVPVSGPFSIASNLVGFDTLLLEAATEPNMVAEAMVHMVEGQVRFAQAIKEAQVDVAFFESAACPPMLSPQLFRQIELPALEQIMTRIAEVVGHPIPCIIGGNTAPIVEPMLETGTGYLVAPFETDQDAFMAQVAHCLDIRIRINMDLRVVASGTYSQIEVEADRVLAVAGDRPNVCLGTGALPFETDPENVRYLMQYVERVSSQA